MPPKNRPKKDPGEDPAAWREHQRRLRNRLSQKAVRERKAARIQQLEQQLATVTKGGESARISELLKTNSRLRHALLDTRKKLASLSVTATQLGERIKVALDDHDDAEQEDSDTATTTNHADIFDNQAYNIWKDNPPPCTQSPPTSSTESIPRGQDPAQFHDPDIELINPGPRTDVEASYLNAMPNQSDKILVPMDSVFDGSRFSDVIHTLFPSPPIAPKLNIYTGSALSQHLNQIHGLLRLGGALEGRSSMPPIVNNMMEAFLNYGWPSMKYWFEATQSMPLGASVLWWQTSNSQEAATQVPPGNTPTLIQLSRPKYPCILDWVPHPGLRDNLILNYHSYDIDQVVCDITQSYVVEIEESVPVMCADDPRLALPARNMNKGYSCNLMELVEQTLVFGPMDNQSQRTLTVMKLLKNSDAEQYATIEHPIHRFKMDPKFFDKYPALYDVNAESKYRPKNTPFVQKSPLPLPFTTQSATDYMNIALNKKNTMIAT